MRKMIVILALALIAPACASKSQLQKARTEGFTEADRQCLELQGRIQERIAQLKSDLAAKNERLRRFNQINEDGTLRTKAVDDSKGWDKQGGSNDEGGPAEKDLLAPLPVKSLTKPAATK